MIVILMEVKQEAPMSATEENAFVISAARGTLLGASVAACAGVFGTKLRATPVRAVQTSGLKLSGGARLSIGGGEATAMAVEVVA